MKCELELWSSHLRSNRAIKNVAQKRKRTKHECVCSRDFQEISYCSTFEFVKFYQLYNHTEKWLPILGIGGYYLTAQLRTRSGKTSVRTHTATSGVLPRLTHALSRALLTNRPPGFYRCFGVGKQPNRGHFKLLNTPRLHANDAFESVLIYSCGI